MDANHHQWELDNQRSGGSSSNAPKKLFTGYKKHTYSNGDVYEGDFKNDFPHGKGKMTYTNGTVYEGDWVYTGEGSNRHGKGKWTENGNVYEGDFVKGKFHGKGKLTFASGNVYEGDWVGGLIQGKGIFTDGDDGKVYEAIFENGKPSKLIREISSSSTPEIVEFTFDNGDKYEGEVANGSMHGKGKYTYAENGAVYEGDFVNSRQTGKGKYTFPSGVFYEGDFVDGNFHGKGKVTDTDGNILDEGNFKDGEFIG